MRVHMLFSPRMRRRLGSTVLGTSDVSSPSNRGCTLGALVLVGDELPAAGERRDRDAADACHESRQAAQRPALQAHRGEVS